MTTTPDYEGVLDTLKEHLNRADDAGMISRFCDQAIRTLMGEKGALLEALTASGDTKAAYHGEFKFQVTQQRENEDPDSDEEFEDYLADFTVPWTTVKEIMSAIKARALTGRGGGGMSVHSGLTPSIPTEQTRKPVLVRLSEREQTCLLSIYKMAHGEEGYGVYMRDIAADTGLYLEQARRSVRACARKGVTELVRGLFDDDGMVAGSGYGLTPAGAAWVKATTTASQAQTGYEGRQAEVSPSSSPEPVK